MELDADFREFAELLNEHKVEYLIVGGYSVAYHGYPRFTGDFDIWINPTKSNSKKIIAALENFGFGSFGLDEKDFHQPDKVIQFGVEPLRIDIMTAIDGLDNFDEAYKRRDTGRFGNMKIDFISFQDLIENKKATNRLQDKADVEKLNEIKKRKS